jgi:hypothetical protein
MNEFIILDTGTLVEYLRMGAIHSILPWKTPFYVTDITWRTLPLQMQQSSRPYIRKNLLKIRTIRSSAFHDMEIVRDAYPQLSLSDCSTLALAHYLSGTILSFDPCMLHIAESLGVDTEVWTVK